MKKLLRLSIPLILLFIITNVTHAQTKETIKRFQSKIEINLDGTIVEDQVGSLINVNNTRPQSSQISDLLPLVTGEGIVIYVRNNDAINNITVLNILLTLTKI